MPRWFLILNGVALLLMGCSLLVLRLRERPLYRHFFGIVWAILCCVVGILLLLMGKGYLAQPGATTPPAGGLHRGSAPEFPSGS
jgi:hypothetical protein